MVLFLEPFKHVQFRIVFTNVKYSFSQSDSNLDLQKTCLFPQIYYQVFLIHQPSADVSPEQIWKIPLGFSPSDMQVKAGDERWKMSYP